MCAPEVVMCGRYQFDADGPAVAAHFDLAGDPPSLLPRYNVAQAQVVAVVGLKADGARRGLALLRWGFVPRWVTTPLKSPPINARAETAATLPTFRDAFRSRRCLIPASGFYEWVREGERKVPHHFRPTGGGMLTFAGLWDVWRGGGDEVATCCILTVTANEVVRPVHDRMPAILPPEDYAAWLDPKTPKPVLHAMLRPYPAGGLEDRAVGPAVNSVRNGGPECLATAA